MFERYTDRSRRAVVLAQEHARMLRHNEISQGHLLLGLAAEEGGVASQALANLGLDPGVARSLLLQITPSLPVAPAGHIPFSRILKRAMEDALRESIAQGVNYIGTEHLLVGLLRDPEGQAASILISAGITPPAARDEVMRLLAGYEKAGGPRVTEAAPAGPSDVEVQAAATVLLRDYEDMYDASHLSWQDFAGLATKALEAAQAAKGDRHE